MKHKIAHLKRNDPVLRKVIEKTKISPSAKWDRPQHFRSLVTAIVNQQLSGKAADTTLRRVVALFPRKKFPTPKDILAAHVGKLRKAGLSRMKAAFLKDLSRRIEDRSLKLASLQDLEDKEVIIELVKVKGIGRWTAEMFLMFSLGRDDVFSYGDLGLRNAIQKLYKLKAHPTPAQAERISAKWKPYRTLACRYLWASMDGAKT